ncbi:MAG TPA: hypothetical protein VL997_09350 [Dyella sp.]|nr:hypothetical protein [Dyella sp.]
MKFKETDTPILENAEELRETLLAVASALRSAIAPWWIISGAAAALYGATERRVADVDVLVDLGDTAHLVRTLGIRPAAGTSHDHFHSEWFARWNGLPLTVEFMANFQVRTQQGWVRMLPATRHAIVLSNTELFVPARAELISMFECFGRPKDLLRAELLKQHA